MLGTAEYAKLLAKKPYRGQVHHWLGQQAKSDRATTLLDRTHDGLAVLDLALKGHRRISLMVQPQQLVQHGRHQIADDLIPDLPALLLFGVTD